ncbi:MAG: hypothetical protein M9962_06765 [Oligoflexia bacterium]|nr:hypothetical protein [Oligoflexia bacterium]
MKHALSLFLLSISLFNPTVRATEVLDTKIIETYVDATYDEGDSAILRTQFFSKPDNQNLEFDLISKINDVEISVHRINDFEIFSTLEDLAIGSYTWAVQVVLQDKRLATDLKISLTNFANRISEIDTELLDATDPEEIADLEAERAELVELSSTVQDQLTKIRTPFLNPITKTFIVE